MTMQHPTHPDDERLAALAGDDPEVTSDAALRAHVESCDRCADMLRELGSLRAALSELPDLVPSRPLQLLPPVAEPKAAAGGGWLRRLAGPAMAAGFVLVLVGAIGSSGFNLEMAGGAGQIFQNVGENLAAGPEGAPGASASDAEHPTPPRSLEGGGTTSQAGPSGDAAPSSDALRSAAPTQPDVAPQPADEGGSTSGLFESTDPRLPWLLVLAFGVGLLFAGVYLRFARQPRAG
jgi:hypothetical protein